MPDVQISRIAVGPRAAYRRSTRGPEILLCGSGSVELSCPEGKLPLGRGQSAFVAADACDYEIRAAREALVYRASVPEIAPPLDCIPRREPTPPRPSCRWPR